ncbi:hypothetical protein LTR53_015627 [Teratosphaeriaceae sp. CCFEE 6253]|nr:hypothetical protein LTR53_015627 [Teratosphaeriaceae sp. CCFEE 6253]
MAGGPAGGDVAAETLAQTQDGGGNSVLMMAVEAGQKDALAFLLSLPAHFRAEFVLDDVNEAGTTLLSAAVQGGDRGITDLLLDFLEKEVSPEQLQRYLRVQDAQGRSMAHYLFHQPHLLPRLGRSLPWRLKARHGQTPLFALCRSYDHAHYPAMVSAALALAGAAQGDGEALHLDEHVDAKGNTLLHVVVDTQVTVKLLRQTDVDVNAANERRFTPLMVGSKYGRIETVRALFGDPRTDVTLTDLRGLTAVELAKDDEVRNRIDDLVLLSSTPGKDGRTTTLVRAFFAEDATARFVLKSGAPHGPDSSSITVTTCRRSVADFENLVHWLSTEHPASWLPLSFNFPSPCLLPSRPSRAVLRDQQLRLDNLLRALLAHATFATHELVWEFFLVPELDAVMLTERSQRKAEARVGKLREEFIPVGVGETQAVENFVAVAKEQVRAVTQATRRVLRAVNRVRMRGDDAFESLTLLSGRLSNLRGLPPSHSGAFERYARGAQPTDASPWTALYYNLHSTHSTSTALQVALNRPAYLIGSMSQLQRNIDRLTAVAARAQQSSGGSSRWAPRLVAGLLLSPDEVGAGKKSAAAAGAEPTGAGGKVAKARAELESLGCELASTQQTVASELAGWQDEHVRFGVAGLKRLARGMVVRERGRLEGMRRALREARKGG